MNTDNNPLTAEQLIINNLGPLAALAGSWEGDQGVDISPSVTGAVESKYRERITFEPMGPVNNGPQTLYGLRYTMVAWRLGENDAFHEELGYWLWDANAQQVMRCFIVPRGVAVNAGGHAKPHTKVFEMTAEVGSVTFGVMSNPFLDEAFKTVRYNLKVTLLDDRRFSYFEDTQLSIKDKPEIFHHTDQNTLVKCV